MTWAWSRRSGMTASRPRKKPSKKASPPSGHFRHAVQGQSGKIGTPGHGTHPHGHHGLRPPAPQRCRLRGPADGLRPAGTGCRRGRRNRNHDQVRSYISRQMEQVEKMNRLEQKKMPTDIVYADIDTLSGDSTIAAAIPRRCFMPREYLRKGLLSDGFSPTRRNVSPICACETSRLISQRRERFFAPVNSSIKIGFSKQKANASRE